jgi:tRNA (cytidine/uridine-2'-O-)-methyltransferase
VKLNIVLHEPEIPQNTGNSVRIPMKEEARSLNLSNAVAVMAYEVLRQNSFNFLKKEGELHRLAWE